MENSTTLIKRREVLEDFLRDFDGMLSNCDSIDNWPDTIPTFRPKPDREAVVRRQAGELQLKTAVAARIVQELGIEFRYKPRGTMGTVPVNPVYAWQSIFQGDPMVDAQFVYDACNQAIGLLNHQAREALEHEQTVAGRVERIVATPHGIWRALRGVPNAARHQKTGFISGIAVAAIGGALTVLIVYLVHLL